MSRAGQLNTDPSASLGISPADSRSAAASLTPARQLKITWSPRDCALLPAAVAGQGEISLRLARRLLQMDDETLGQLEGVAGEQLIIVQGKSDLLPWVEGVQYLGVDRGVPTVLFPTNYQPSLSLPPELLARALRAKTGTQELIALLRQPLLVVPMGSARPVSRTTLSSWLESA
jgi:hypothetical protein